MYKIINNHFKNHFHKENIPAVARFDGPPRPLNRPLTTNEITKTTSNMKNNKATFDTIPVEFVKYAPTCIHGEVARVLNNVFEKHEDIHLGEGVLIPLQKPKPKTIGPVKNLRPITLLATIRKILSRATTTRVAPKTNEYLSKSQSAYRLGRSTGDITWSYRWILAKVQEVEIKIYIIGIDMSSAFDTIDRQKLVDIVESFLDEDEARIVRRLLSNTTIEVRVKGAETTPFISNIGSPQGGSISGPLFEIYFENSLREVRSEIVKYEESQNIQKNETSLPDEMIYADDCDFLTMEVTTKQYVNENTDEILLQHNLLVNTDKTENTTLVRHVGKDSIEKEDWRKVKKLGSLLGDREDIARRKQLATSSLQKLSEIWRRNRRLKIRKKVQLYNALVRTILLYNCGTWGMSQTDEDKMNSFHRKQLRHVLNIHYPYKITSKQLYKVTNTHPITPDITKSRWKLFGHTLRMDKDTPARRAMKFYFEERTEKKYRGRKRTTIVSTLNRDRAITKKKYPTFDLPLLQSELDLHNMRVKAKDKRNWKKRVELVFKAAYSSKLKKL